jgi:hypothetical protein
MCVWALGKDDLLRLFGIGGGMSAGYVAVRSWGDVKLRGLGRTVQT